MRSGKPGGIAVDAALRIVVSFVSALLLLISPTLPSAHESQNATTPVPPLQSLKGSTGERSELARPQALQNNTSATGSKWYSPPFGGSSAPSYRFGEALAYDPLIPGDLLFGGYNNSAGFLRDTWLFQDPGHQWKPVTSATPPPVRYLAMTTFDPALGGVLMFGGAQDFSGLPLNDTWLFKDGNWTQLHPSTSPPADAGSLAWEPAAGYAVLLIDSYPMQTWTFSGSSWTRIGGVEPSPRTLESLTYDGRDGALLLFGGQALNSSGGPSGVFMQDTWEFSAGSWSLHSTTGAPSPRMNAGLVFDTAQNASILYGGSNFTVRGGVVYPTYQNDTWIYRGGTWTSALTPPAPVGRWLSSMTYDASGGFALMVYGQDIGGATLHDTWIYLASLRVSGTVTPTVGDAPLNVNLSAVPSGGWGPYSYSWSVTGLSAVALLNTTRTLDIAGNYTAAFQVADQLGSTTSLAFRVEVNDPLVVHILDVPSNGTAPLKVHFTALPTAGTPPYVFNWTFGGTLFEVGPDVNFTFASAGRFNVTLTASDFANDSRASASVFVVVKTASSPGNGSTGAGKNGSSTFLGLPAIEGYALLGGMVLAIVVGAILLAFRKPKRKAPPVSPAPSRRAGKPSAPR